MFTAPRAGVYLITFSYDGRNNPGEKTYVYVHLNGVRLGETIHHTGYTGGTTQYTYVGSTGGRAVYQRLEPGDTLTLQTGTVTGDMWNIIFCVQFINN